MNRLVVALFMMIACTVVAQQSSTENTTTPVAVRWTETNAERPTPTPDPNRPRQSSRDREATILQHQARIDKIIQENQERMKAGGNARGDAVVRKQMKPGWIVRVAEGLTSPARDRLVQQLKEDGFNAESIGQSGYIEVFVHCGDDQIRAKGILRGLKELDYQFHSLRYGRIVERITPMKDDDETTGTGNQDDTTTR